MHVTEGWRWHSPGSPRQLTLATVELPALGDRDVLIESHREEVGIGSCFVHHEQ